ncbi:MAG TPA: MurR/RpiR family transcriptional regulator [Clostridiales bacterium]|nr:MurR/RpiR family transcriptional regulator [Clostridiales bacterium]
MVRAVIAKIISLQNNFTVGENEIAQYIMNNADEVVTSTITTIAKNTNTSEASVNRFCKKIGFKGFNSFKVALAQETFYNNMNRSDKPSEDESFISSVSRDYRHLLRSTSAMLDEEDLLKAADAIKKASIVYIISYSSNAFIAKEAEYKLTMVGIKAKAIINITDMHICVANVRPTDLIIYIVNTIIMRDIFLSLNTGHDRNATIISITSYDSPKLDNLVDYKFVTSDKIIAKNSQSISNSLVFLYVLDVIYSYLLDNDKALTQKKLNNEAIINNHQVLDNHLYDY